MSARSPRTDSAAAALELRGHLPVLDGLRAVAVILVMLFHFGWRQPVGAAAHLYQQVVLSGWVGVDLFFVLSGFLITGILADAKGGPGYFRNFYMRRVLRIFPLYYLALVAVFIVVPAVHPAASAQLRGLLERQGYFWSYTSNLLGLVEPEFAVPVYVGHFWSLAVEEQFYLLWPLVVAAGSRAAVMRLSLLLLAVSCGARVSLWLAGGDPTPWFGFTLTRLDGLAVGAFLALALRGPHEVARVRRIAAGALVASVVGMAAVAVLRGGFRPYDPAVQSVGLLAAVVAFGATLVLVLAASPASRVGRVLGGRALGRVGQYSYAMYVFHLPVAVVLQRTLFAEGGAAARLPGFFLPQALYVSVAFAATLGAAWVSWHVCEKHFLRLKHRFPRHERAIGLDDPRRQPAAATAPLSLAP